MWTLTPIPQNHHYILYINNNGYLTWYWAIQLNNVYPTLYLKSNVKIINGNGSRDNPYILSI